MRWLGAMLCVLAIHTASVTAQTSGGDSTAGVPPAAADSTGSPIDPAKLPVSLSRIRLELAMKPESKTSGLKIHETIEVVGVAPKVQLWNPEKAKLATGPVPWGAPTHQDFIDLVTPQEFKNYPIDINSLVHWLLQHLGDKREPTDRKPA